MREQDFLKIIQNEIGDEYIGDDCAYLKEFGIVVSQDSLVEDIHFKRDWYTPYQLGYKSIAVNISDILASGAKPDSVTIAISLPNDTSDNFINEFYKGAKKALCCAKIVGGDITGSTDKIYISVTAIGSTKNRNISSRKNAKEGYKILITSPHGLSAAGLKELEEGKKDTNLIKEHLEPKLNYEFSEEIATNIKVPYAMMDTSDGLADALFKIAQASGVSINIDYEKIPKEFGVIEPDFVLFGGEDYKLVAVVPESAFNEIKSKYYVIGDVFQYDGYYLNVLNKKYKNYDELNIYNHFRGNNNG